MYIDVKCEKDKVITIAEIINTGYFFGMSHWWNQDKRKDDEISGQMFDSNMAYFRIVSAPYTCFNKYQLLFSIAYYSVLKTFTV